MCTWRTRIRTKHPQCVARGLALRKGPIKRVLNRIAEDLDVCVCVCVCVAAEVGSTE